MLKTEKIYDLLSIKVKSFSDNYLEHGYAKEEFDYSLDFSIKERIEEKLKELAIPYVIIISEDKLTLESK